MSLEGADQRDLYVAIGIDCDPDRDTYPWRLTWRGVEALSTLFDIPDVRWTFNVRADTQIRAYCGAADYCWRRYRDLWTEALRRGDAIAWHLHYFGRDGLQDTTDANVLENIEVGAEALGGPDIVHMGGRIRANSQSRGLPRVVCASTTARCRACAEWDDPASMRRTGGASPTGRSVGTACG